MSTFENNNYEEDEIIWYCEECDNEIIDGKERFPTVDWEWIVCSKCGYETLTVDSYRY